MWTGQGHGKSSVSLGLFSHPLNWAGIRGGQARLRGGSARTGESGRPVKDWGKGLV